MHRRNFQGWRGTVSVDECASKQGNPSSENEATHESDRGFGKPRTCAQRHETRWRQTRQHRFVTKTKNLQNIS